MASDHRELCKFDSANSKTYTKILQWIRNLPQRCWNDKSRRTSEPPQDDNNSESKSANSDDLRNVNTEPLHDADSNSESTSATSGALVDLKRVVAFLLSDNALLRRLVERVRRVKPDLERVPSELGRLIKALGQKLERKALKVPNVFHYMIAQELIQHKEYLSFAVLTNDKDQHENEVTRRLRKSKLEESLQIIRKSKRDYQSTEGSDFGHNDLDPRPRVTSTERESTQAPADNTNLPASKSAFDQARDFVQDNDAFDAFLASLSGLLYSSHINAIKDELLLDFSLLDISCSVSLLVRHELGEYLSKELPHFCNSSTFSIRQILTLTGKIEQCYSHNAETYMKQQWPKTHHEVLNTFDRLLGLTSTAKQGITQDISSEESNTEATRLAASNAIHIEFEVKDPRTAGFLIEGPPGLVIETVQQISWLTAAIRPPKDRRMSTSQNLLERITARHYNLHLFPLQAIEDDKKICWLPLFMGASLVSGYPVPSRGEEIGVELPFDLMVSLAEPMYPSKADGGIYFQGFSRAMYPTSRSKDGESLQWHLISSTTRRQKLEFRLPSTKDWIQIETPAQLARARTFLGVYREGAIHLGTTGSRELHRQIAFSGASEETPKPMLGAPTSFTAGTSGMGIFGMTATASIIYGKSLCHAANDVDHDFLDIVDICKERPVILYDTADDSERGWMVPLLCVILHLMHTWAARKQNSQICIPCVDPTWNGKLTASTLLMHEDDTDILTRPTRLMGTLSGLDGEIESIARVSAQSKKLKSLVKHFWKCITQRVEEDLKASAEQPRIDFDLSKLYGWDYMDLVVEKPYHRLQVPFEGNWGPFTRDVLVLFGKGFGEVIRPSEGVRVCPMWNPVPPNRQYLVAMVDCLRWLAWTRGGTYDAMRTTRVTDKHQWIWDDTRIFEDCPFWSQNDAVKQRECAKTPQSLSSWSTSRPPDVTSTPPQSAVVVFWSKKIAEAFKEGRHL